MLQSCKFNSYLGYDKETLLYNYDIDIIDSDFQERINMSYEAILSPTNSMLATAIIQVYSKRNLNVAYNLFLFMKNLENEFRSNSFYSLSKQIFWFKERVKDFDKYLPEIKKYLALI